MAYDATMVDKLNQLRRRPFFLPLFLPVLGFIVLAVAAAWFVDARATTIVIVLRHAETEDSDSDPSLSVAGRERAAHLVRLLHEAKPVRGIDAIYASELRRTQQTVTPLAETSALPVNVVPADTWNSLPARIRRQHHGENVVVVGSASTIPPLVEALAGEAVTIKEDEYDAMFVIFLPQIAHARLVKLHY